MKSEIQLHHYEDENLVRRAASGNLDAFNELVLEYQNMVYHQALSVLGDPSLAEDAVQDSFIRAFQGISGFRAVRFGHGSSKLRPTRHTMCYVV